MLRFSDISVEVLCRFRKERVAIACVKECFTNFESIVKIAIIDVSGSGRIVIQGEH